MFKQTISMAAMLTVIATPIAAQAQVTPYQQFLADYVGAMSDMGYGFAISDKLKNSAIDVARSSCEALDAGATVAAVFTEAREAALSSQNREAVATSLAASLMSGIKNFCPQHQDELNLWTSTLRPNPTPVGRSGNPLD